MRDVIPVFSATRIKRVTHNFIILKIYVTKYKGFELFLKLARFCLKILTDADYWNVDISSLIENLNFLFCFNRVFCSCYI